MNLFRIFAVIASITILASCNSRQVEKRKARNDVWIRTIDINCSDCERSNEKSDSSLRNIPLAHGGIIASTKDISHVWLTTEKNRNLIVIFIRRESAGRVKSAQTAQMGRDIVVVSNGAAVWETKLEEDMSQGLALYGLSNDSARFVFDSITEAPTGAPN